MPLGCKSQLRGSQPPPHHVDTAKEGGDFNSVGCRVVLDGALSMWWSCGCPCSLQGSGTRWPLEVPSNSDNSMILSSRGITPDSHCVPRDGAIGPWVWDAGSPTVQSAGAPAFAVCLFSGK